jgi:hypothetical protein
MKALTIGLSHNHYFIHIFPKGVPPKEIELGSFWVNAVRGTL